MTDENKPDAVVVLSGGQDSTTTLFWAMGRFNVRAISFDYAQRHRRELECASKIAEIAQIPHEILDAGFINKLTANALTRPEIAVDHKPGELPTTFVDGRNLFFLSMAAVYAKAHGAYKLVTGVCQTDFSDYPDCRREFVDSLEKTLNLAMAPPQNFTIETPLMWLTKAATVAMAIGLDHLHGGKVMEALAWSHTCYSGTEVPCGTCPACILRAKGFAHAGIEDPIFNRLRREGKIL